MDRTELGLRMQQWHSSQWDPIYMVGSLYFSDEVYPDKDIAELALCSLECGLDKFRRMDRGIKVRAPHTEDLRKFAGYTRKTLRDGIADLREIVASLREYIADDYPESEES